MYLAQYSNSNESLRQIAIRLESHLAEVPDHDENWRNQFYASLNRTLGQEAVDVAFRIAARERMLERVFVFTASHQEEALLQQIGNAFADLGRLKSDCVQLAQNRRHHDEMLGWFPSKCGCVDNHPYTHQGIRLAPSFQLFPVMGQFIVKAFQQKWRFCYQANIRRHRPSTEEYRAARKNFVMVEDAGLPPKLVAHQRQLVHNLNKPNFLIDEYIGVESDPAFESLSAMSVRHFEQTLRPIGFASSPVQWGEVDQLADFLFTGFHTSMLGDDDPLAHLGSAVDRDFVGTVLQWRPPRVRAPEKQKKGGKHNFFISYRRSDEPLYAQQIRDRLTQQFGRESVFMDIDSIPFGIDFAKYIDKVISECDVVLVVIGGSWLDVRFEDGPMKGQRRLDDPNDFVRLEVQSALARDIPVVPVLVGRGKMPGPAQLPDVLETLPKRNAAEIRPGADTEHHLDRLIRGVGSLLETRE